MDTIKINKGLDIRIPGTAEEHVTDMLLEGLYAIKPTDYVGVNPRLSVSEGDAVLAGTPLFEDKNNAAARFVSPVSGIVRAIVRGEKRALLAVVVESDGQQRSISLPFSGDIRQTMIESGLWTLLRQRPFGIIPQSEAKPKAIFISAFDSSPLPVDIPFMLKGREEDFCKGIEVLSHFTGNIHVGCNAEKQSLFTMHKVPCAIHRFDGPHPAGLVGTQIAMIDPINKGETVWTLNAQDVAIIGNVFNTKQYRPWRMVALCGPVFVDPHYFRVAPGACAADICGGKGTFTLDNVRLISGDVLSGTSIAPNGFICASTDKISVLPEGDYYDFMGWLRPNFRKFSISRTFLSGFLLKSKKSKMIFDTNRHGSLRPLFVTGEFEKLVPLDIYPMQLIKACVIGDIELMENLGIYEVEPEDLALCEFADTSKTEIQAVIRAGLEKIRKEC